MKQDMNQELNQEEPDQTINQQIMNLLSARPLDWQKCNQLMPAIIQHAISGQVLMQGYMNPESLQQTIKTKKITFWSRSKNRLWTKGESSGHFLELVSLHVDCDGDSILILANPNGPTCHEGTTSCFDSYSNDEHPIQSNASSSFSFLFQLEQYLKERRFADPKESYTASLFASGTKRMAQKVGEEGVEVALAATVHDHNELLNESADLLYHLMILLEDQDLCLNQVINVLQERHNK